MPKHFQLFFFPSDHSVEMFDTKQRRVFLKRTPMPTVELSDLVIGSAVNLLGRQLVIQSFADDYTRTRIQQHIQHGVALVQASQHFGAIVDAFIRAGFSLSRLRMVQFDSKAKNAFQQTHPNDSFAYEGRAIAVELLKHHAVEDLKKVIAEVKSTYPSVSLYNSPSDTLAQIDLEFFFGSNAQTRFPRVARLQNTTLCLIKPHAVRANQSGSILDAVLKAGFDVTDITMVSLDRVNASEFYEVYKTVVPEYNAMVDELTTGPCVALEIAASETTSLSDSQTIVSAFRQFCGPSDPEIARHIRPESVRAKFGVDKIRNGVHCTDLTEDGALEVQYFFQILAL